MSEDNKTQPDAIEQAPEETQEQTQPEIVEEVSQPEQSSEEPAAQDISKCPACGSQNIEKVSDYFTCKDCDKNFN